MSRLSRVLAIGSLFAMMSAGPALADHVGSHAADGPRLTAKWMQVKDLIKPMAQATGRNVVLDRDAGDAEVVVSLHEGQAKGETLKKIVTALEAQGLTVNDDGKVIRITR